MNYWNISFVETFSKLWVQMSQLFAGTSELYCMSVKCSYWNFLFMLQNLVIMSVIWPRPQKYKVFLSSCEPHWSQCLVVFSPWQSTIEINVLLKKSDIYWEESIVHRKKNYMNIYIYTVHLFLYECITCKVKYCLSNYCTFHISYVTTNTQKYKITSK